MNNWKTESCMLLFFDVISSMILQLVTNWRFSTIDEKLFHIFLKYRLVQDIPISIVQLMASFFNDLRYTYVIEKFTM